MIGFKIYRRRKVVELSFSISLVDINGREGFTVIELVFVIVILGVLAAVTLPKFLGVRTQAENQIIKSFASTLTRTVGHTLWSQSIANGQNGLIKDDNSNITSGGKKLEYYVDIPTELNASSVDFSRCVEGSGTAQPFMTPAQGYEYNIFCRDGNATNAPKFVASKDATYTF